MKRFSKKLLIFCSFIFLCNVVVAMEAPAPVSGKVEITVYENDLDLEGSKQKVASDEYALIKKMKNRERLYIPSLTRGIWAFMICKQIDDGRERLIRIDA